MSWFAEVHAAFEVGLKRRTWKGTALQMHVAVDARSRQRKSMIFFTSMSKWVIHWWSSRKVIFIQLPRSRMADVRQLSLCLHFDTLSAGSQPDLPSYALKARHGVSNMFVISGGPGDWISEPNPPRVLGNWGQGVAASSSYAHKSVEMKN